MNVDILNAHSDTEQRVKQNDVFSQTSLNTTVLWSGEVLCSETIQAGELLTPLTLSKKGVLKERGFLKAHTSL